MKLWALKLVMINTLVLLLTAKVDVTQISADEHVSVREYLVIKKNEPARCSVWSDMLKDLG